MIRIEDQHWWYFGRRRIVEAMLARLAVQEAEILDMGCGGGGNLGMLARFGRVRGVEMDPGARAVAESRQACLVVDGQLPDQIPFGSEQFDLVTLLDVLEHVADDSGSVRRLAERLKPGGRIVVTVPAYMFLWRKQDDLNHHHRRYTRRHLRELFLGNGLQVEHVTHYNVLLFPLIAGIILTNKLLRWEQAGDNRIPPRLINRLLGWILAVEHKLVPFSQLPFGASILLVARKGQGPTSVTSFARDQ